MPNLEELLGQKVDIVTKKGLHQLIRDRILNEAVPLSKLTQLNNRPYSSTLGRNRSKVPHHWGIEGANEGVLIRSRGL